MALIFPHFDYCSVLWMDCAENLREKVERTQNYGMRLECSIISKNDTKRILKKTIAMGAIRFTTTKVQITIGIPMSQWPGTSIS